MNAIRKACTISLLLALVLPGAAQSRLRTTPLKDGGEASLYGILEHGDFRPGYSSSSLWKAGAFAEGNRVGQRITYTGRFAFEQMQGTNMFTSMFVHPGYFPIDVLEFTPGDKTLQTYSFSGGLGFDLSPRWIAGGSIRYSAANYAKRKDIRYTGYALDMEVEPTLLYRFPEGWDVQGGVLWRKVSETIDAEQVGSATDESYYAFLDKGMRYGAYEVWDGAGLHLDEAGVGLLPVKEIAWGGSLQVNRGKFQARLRYLRLHGLVGEKGYDWFRFPGHEGRIDLSWGGWTLQLTTRADRLDEAVLDRVSQGGVTTPEIYGYNSVSDRIHATALLSWRKPVPRGWVLATVNGTGWTEQSALEYPYRDRLSMLSARGSVEVRQRWGRWAAGATLSGGFGKYREQGLEAVATGLPDKEPFRLLDDWVRRMEYLTASRASVRVLAIYHVASVPGLSLQAEGSWEHGFALQYAKGAERQVVRAAIGYTF